MAAKRVIRKISDIRWMLVVYDTLIYAVFAYIFFIHYRGGGLLEGYEPWIHIAISYTCIMLSRMFGRVYHQIWRYGGVECYIILISFDVIAACCYMLLNYFLPIPNIAMSRAISVCMMNLLSVLLMRMLYRYAYKCGNDDTPWNRMLLFLFRLFAGKDINQQRLQNLEQVNIAIVGAGRVGVCLAEELLNNKNASSRPVCFIDIDDIKVGRSIHGIPVFSEQEATFARLDSYNVKEIVFAVPMMDKERKKQLFEFYKQQHYSVKIYDYPVMRAAGAKRQLRSFEVEDVLFRRAIDVIDEKSRPYYKDKVILVTGGGGSIGSELSRQVAKMGPKKLILLDVYENGVYDVQQELRILYGKTLELYVEIVSIANKKGLARVFEEYHPDIVINAAAHKHVPLMEKNCIEAVENNVFGTLNVIELCEEYHVERFMMLSTDKAVNPTNIMGATKRVCEMIMQAYSTRGTIRCSATRFGNVLGSAGSVIPLFKKQIANGGPITLTDKRIIRYFMTIPEASQLVLQSGAMAKNGDLFVLDMGEPVRILDLAENMIRLSGLQPYQDIDIIETGLRPGEKLYEELLVKSDDLVKTDNELIFIEHEEPVSMEELEEKLAILQRAIDSDDDTMVRKALHQVVPTFYRPEEINKAIAG